jgi:hypothetical protein
LLPRLAVHYGYAPTVPNPDYRPNAPTGEQGEATIPNPADMSEFVANAMMNEMIERALGPEIAQAASVAAQNARAAEKAKVNGRVVEVP